LEGNPFPQIISGREAFLNDFGGPRERGESRDRLLIEEAVLSKESGRKSRSGKGDDMPQSQISVRTWLARNKGEMIVCPYQPGQLTISKNACSRRHLMGKKEDLNEIQKGNDPLNYTYVRGLSLCKECPIGKKLSVKQKQVRA
jgi:hypothetical protein